MKKRERQLVTRLKHQIIFLENKARSEIELEDWKEKFKTFAEVTPVSENKFESLEGMNFGHIITEGFYLFKLRFIEGISINMRIHFKGRNFNIKRIININEQDRLLQIIALEI